MTAIKLTAEQLLAIADALAERQPIHVRSFAALAGAAAVPGARFEGIPVFDTAAAAAAALADAIVRLAPLSAHNEEFAQVAYEVYLKWSARN